MTHWTVACQAPLPLGSSWREYWSGLPFPFPGDLPDPGIEPVSPASPALAGGLFTTKPPGNPHFLYISAYVTPGLLIYHPLPRVVAVSLSSVRESISAL